MTSFNSLDKEDAYRKWILHIVDQYPGLNTDKLVLKLMEYINPLTFDAELFMRCASELVLEGAVVEMTCKMKFNENKSFFFFPAGTNDFVVSHFVRVREALASEFLGK